MRRIAHLSDIHFGGENTAAVAGVRAWLAANPPDVTVISGDLTRFGQLDEFDKAAAFVSSLSGPMSSRPETTTPLGQGSGSASPGLSPTISATSASRAAPPGRARGWPW